MSCYCDDPRVFPLVEQAIVYDVPVLIHTWSIVGGKFLYHPKLQKFTVRVADATHPSTKDLPATFEWEDECYFHENLNPDIHVLLAADWRHRH